MKKFHITAQGPKICRASKRPCPLGSPEEHYPSFLEAQKVYEQSFAREHLKGHRKSQGVPWAEELLETCRDRYPEGILKQLGAYLDSRPFKTLVLLPAGSDLYGTKIPGRARHDYDFTAFVTPHESRKGITQYMEGELDISLTNVSELPELSRRSVPLAEAFHAYRQGAALGMREDEAWSPYLRSLRVPLTPYFDLLTDVLKYHEVVEPVVQDGSKNAANLKHRLRWLLYQERWGQEGEGAFDPRLTPEEITRWQRAIREGREEVLYT